MINGILAVNKPEGISSAGVVARVKRLLKVKKVGHTGTLDPFATGVLLCAVNKGTKISRFFLDGRKRYRAILKLGVETDTYDRTGQVVSTVDDTIVQDLETSVIQSVVEGFKGSQKQVPPSFSALKKDGQPLYKLARKGIQVEKPARAIEIFEIKVLKIDHPMVEFDVYCSAGTYIRTIAYDIGKKLGCGAHLAELCRTRSSQFALGDTIDLAVLEKMDKETALSQLVSLSESLDFIPRIVVPSELIKKIQFGQRLSAKELGLEQTGPDNNINRGPIRLVDDENQLLAIVNFDSLRQTYNYSCVFLA